MCNCFVQCADDKSLFEPMVTQFIFIYSVNRPQAEHLSFKVDASNKTIQKNPVVYCNVCIALKVCNTGALFINVDQFQSQQWLSNYKLFNGITCSRWSCQWINTSILHFTGHMITSLSWDFSRSMLVKGTLCTIWCDYCQATRLYRTK